MNTCGNGRLFYKSLPLNQLSQWVQVINDIESFMERNPEVFKARDCAYLYFFSFDEKSADKGRFWCGRDIVGYLPHFPDEFATFDYYAGEVSDIPCLGVFTDLDELFLGARKALEKLNNTASYAQTWRLKIENIDKNKFDKEKEVHLLPQMSFQFFKSP